MKRHQIKRVICNTIEFVSDAQVRKAIADLGFPTEDGHDYDADQVRQIIHQFKPAANSEDSDRAGATLPTDESRALTKHLISQSHATLTSQVQQLATRMDENDLELARQLAHHVATRPQRFSILFAQQLQALLQPIETEPPMFVDVELGAVDFPELNGGLQLAPHSIAGCLPL